MSTAETKGSLEGLMEKFNSSIEEARGSLDCMESLFSDHIKTTTLQQKQMEQMEQMEIASLKRESASILEWTRKCANLQAQLEVERASKTCKCLPHIQAPQIQAPQRLPLAEINNRPELMPESSGWRKVHESFLDTPQETILRELAAPLRSHGSPGSTGVLTKDRRFPVRADDHNEGFISPRGKTSAMGEVHKAPTFKYNEVIRNKREREALLATECKLCKRFYDAVYGSDVNTVNIERCNHLKTSSRHRYKTLPPETPEGFWNISFDDTEAPAS